MTSQELVIELRIPLTGDRFEDAKATVRVEEIFQMIRERAENEFGSGGYTLTDATLPIRKPRAPRADSGVPRGPRAKKDANGADATTVTA